MSYFIRLIYLTHLSFIPHLIHLATAEISTKYGSSAVSSNCPLNEVFRIDGYRCQTTCDEYGNPDCISYSPKGDCYCENGYIRLKAKGKCVPIFSTECRAKMPPTAASCYVDDIPRVLRWRPHCVCKDGYLRLPSGECVDIYSEECRKLWEHKEDGGVVKIYDIGDFKLQSGITLKRAKIVVKTFGSPQSPCIVYPTWYSGTHEDNGIKLTSSSLDLHAILLSIEWLIGSNKTLNPGKYFIVIFNLFGNGLSSSPSNQPPPFDGPRFPNITLYDNIKAQHKILTERLKIKKIECVLGWSMGAQQSFQWAAQFPDMVKSIVPFCGSARTSIHNIVFLEGPSSALKADAAFANGWYKSQPTKGLRAFARVYAGWGFSQAFYREKIYQTVLGYESLEDFLVRFWEGLFLRKDANNLLSQIWTWQHGDISANKLYESNFEKALGAITARAIVMPGSHDLYFPPEDNEAEVKLMPNAKLIVIPSVWGHWAGGPGTNPIDAQFIDNVLKEFL